MWISWTRSVLKIPKNHAEKFTSSFFFKSYHVNNFFNVDKLISFMLNIPF